MPFDTALLGQVAGAISFAGFFPYVRAMLKRGKPPQRAGWLIWTVVGGLLFFSYRSSGATDNLWVPGLNFVGPLGIWLLSLKYGTGGWEREDKICLTGAAVSLVAWFLTGSPTLAMTLCLVTDCFGSWLIIKKAYRDPRSEDRLSWIIWAVANTLNVFAVPDFTLVFSGYPIYAGVVAWTILVMSFRPPAPSTNP